MKETLNYYIKQAYALGYYQAYAEWYNDSRSTSEEEDMEMPPTLKQFLDNPTLDISRYMPCDDTELCDFRLELEKKIEVLVDGEPVNFKYNPRSNSIHLLKNEEQKSSRD